VYYNEEKMMKKLSILLAALILVTGFTFAQEENGNVEVEVVREREIIREVDIERDVEIVVEQEDPLKPISLIWKSA